MVKRKRFKAPADRISSLCDEVLWSILSLLPFKEAAATSILSRRWKYLWTSTPNLYFDGTELLQKTMINVPDKERSKFIRWVDQVVAACRCSGASTATLKEFVVYFDLTKDYTKSIDKWLRLAVSRRVEMLELILTDKARDRFSTYDKCYVFPYKERLFPNGFSFIKKLSTHYVNVSGEALEFFLGNCPLLEQLSVSASGDLETLCVGSTSAAFKRLEISCCFNLTSVLVCDSNLESFKYGGRRIKNFHLSNVPRLSEIWIGGELVSHGKHAVQMFSCVFPQIERLKVYFHFEKTCLKQTKKFFSSAELPNVKELVVNIRGDCKSKVSLLPLTNLLKASPNVQRFVLEAPGMKTTGANLFKGSTGKYAWSGAYCQQLREVELVGYHGVRSQNLLLKHLLLNFVTIESIFVDTRAFKCSMFDRVYQPQAKDEMLARVHKAKVKKLMKRVPPRIKVKIL